MSGNRKSFFGSPGDTTIIGREAVVVGDIHFGGNLDVEGVVRGNIIGRPDGEALVRVVHGGRVEGEIRAPDVVVNGVVDGDIHSTHYLELAPKGQVNGNVYYNQAEMAAGFEVNGNLAHLAEVAPSAGQQPVLHPEGPRGEDPAGKAAGAKVD